MQNKRKTGIFIAPGRKPWPHELRVAEILSLAGHYVNQMRKQKQIKRIIMVTKRGQIIDISALI